MPEETPFCFPLRPLSNARLTLLPFDPPRHAEAFVAATNAAPELLQYLPYGPWASAAEFESQMYGPRIAGSRGETLFAIFANQSTTDGTTTTTTTTDGTITSANQDSRDGQVGQGQGTFAGVVGYLNASEGNAALEIGFITILPAFHRTYVTSNAVGLLIQYALDLPPHGLGLRRCQWQTHASNTPSRRVAERMLFAFEGVQRFQRVIPAHKVGNGVDVSKLPDVMGKSGMPSRDTAVFAHYCDEWPEKRDLVQAIMDKQQ